MTHSPFREWDPAMFLKGQEAFRANFEPSPPFSSGLSSSPVFGERQACLVVGAVRSHGEFNHAEAGPGRSACAIDVKGAYGG